MAIDVKLQVFEGPLDLLLHLIQKNKIDIYDIPISEITDQYLEYVQAMDRQDMNVTSEFMLMAATLIDLKCRMLLPKEVNEDGEEEDPREELVQQLLAHKEYKFMAQRLRECMDEAGDVICRKQKLPKEVQAYQEPVDLDELLNGVKLSKLREIFEFVLKRQEDSKDPIRSKFGQIEKEEVSLPDKLVFVTTALREKRHCTFRELLETQKGKTQVIVTFLAVLELIKTGGVIVRQEETFGEIYLDAAEGLDTLDMENGFEESYA